MGRPKKIEKDKKVKFGISLDRDLFERMVKDKIRKSTLVNQLLREHYGKKDL
jgi:hypothetical protein